MESPVHHFPIDRLKLLAIQTITISIVVMCSSQLFLHPEWELLSLIRDQLISPKEYAQGFQGESPSRSVGIATSVPNGLLFA